MERFSASLQTPPIAVDPSKALGLFAALLPRLLGVAFLAQAVTLLIAVGYPPQVELSPLLRAAREVGPAGWLPALAWSYQGVLLLAGSGRGLWLSLACTPLMAAGAALFGADPQATAWPLAGLTPLQVAAQLATTPSLLITLPLAPPLWAGYLLHALLLAPAFRMGWLMRRAERQRALRNNTLVLPAAVLELYLRNPFRILGLRPGESRARSVMRRRDEMVTLLGAGLAVEADLPGFVTAAIGPMPSLDEAEVKRAVARIQNDPERCHEALLWFQLDDESDDVLAALAKGDLAAADAAWRHRSGDDAAAAAALYNRAVLAHGRALVAEPASAPPHKLRHGDAWRISHDLWAQVLASPLSWAGIDKLVAQCSDPRVGAGFVGELKKALPVRVLAVHHDFARAALSGGFLAYAKAHAALIEHSVLPDEARQQVLDALFVPLVDALRNAIEPLLEPARERRDTVDHGAVLAAYRAARDPLVALGAAGRVEPVAQQAMAEACERLPRATYAAWRQFNDDDKECFDGTVRLIQRWNLLTGDGVRHVDVTALRSLQALMKGRRQEIDRLRQSLQAYEDAVRRAMLALDCVRVIARDTGAAEREAFEKVVKDENDALARAREEWRKTGEHLERNLQGMVSALGG